MSIEKRISDLEDRTGVNVEPTFIFVVRPGAKPTEEQKQAAIKRALSERDQSIYIVVLEKNEGGEQNDSN